MHERCATREKMLKFPTVARFENHTCCRTCVRVSMVILTSFRYRGLEVALYSLITLEEKIEHVVPIVGSKDVAFANLVQIQGS